MDNCQFGHFNNKDSFQLAVQEFLLKHNGYHIYHHSFEVAQVAEALCEEFNLNPNDGFICGMLHDIGGIFPNEKRVEVAKEMKIHLLDEEIEFPLIIHQKIAVVLAESEFGITNREILHGIGCHTTLRREYTPLDLVLFLADKIAWDQPGTPPYLDELIDALKSSAEEAALLYINFIIRHNLKVLHPWLIAAKKRLEKSIVEQ